VSFCWCVDDESDTASRQSVLRPITSGVNGIPLPSSTTTMSRSGSSASVKTAGSTDATKLPPVVDSRNNGNLCTVWFHFVYMSVHVLPPPFHAQNPLSKKFMLTHQVPAPISCHKFCM